MYVSQVSDLDKLSVVYCLIAKYKFIKTKIILIAFILILCTLLFFQKNTSENTWKYCKNTNTSKNT